GRGVPLAEVSVAKRLADAPRPGVQPRLTPEQVCQILALACEQPSGSGRPISHWSHRELADEIVRRGITDRFSPRHASRLLKSGGPSSSVEGLWMHSVALGTSRIRRMQLLLAGALIAAMAIAVNFHPEPAHADPF